MTSIALDYGTSGHWEGAIPSERLLHHHVGPPPLKNVRKAVSESLASPVEFPALSQALVPDDRIVIVLDRAVASAAEIIAEVWNVFQQAGIAPDRVLILQPAALTPISTADPRRLLPDSVRAAIGWKTHDPTANNATGYLASSAAGERIYLAREVIEADFVLPIGRLEFDPVQGRRSPMTSFYPGLSTTETFARSIGQGHSELGPDNERPLRQLVQEIAWLLGIQFSMLVMPASQRGGASRILSGLPDVIANRGETILDDDWRVMLDQRGETALVSIPSDDVATNWEHLGAAVDAARRLIVKEGRIIVLSDLAAVPSAGIEIIRSSNSAKAALRPLRMESPPDLVAASQIARAADWATMFLLSKLDSTLVEELFMTPLDHEREVARLVAQSDGCIVLAGAQHVYAEINDE